MAAPLSSVAQRKAAALKPLSGLVVIDEFPVQGLRRVREPRPSALVSQ